MNVRINLPYVSVAWILKSSVAVSRKVRFGDAPGFSELQKYDISDNVYEHMTFQRWKKLYVGVGDPSTSC